MTTSRRRILRTLALGAVSVAALSLTSGLPGVAAATPTPIYLNPAYTPIERAADLVSRMTTAEKATQMDSSQAPAIPSLGIAAWGWWNES
ncbi:MAG TPA: hypothetical protein VJ914_18315, partial [Pseudonocardiaceae bacterium]|nr:hypothetical protein [Pseudonocardiaceae bacterium]